MVRSILSIEYIIRADVDQKDSTLFALLCQILGKINVDCLRSDGIFFHHFRETNCNAVDDGVGFYVIQQGIQFCGISNVNRDKISVLSRVASSYHLN